MKNPDSRSKLRDWLKEKNPDISMTELLFGDYPKLRKEAAKKLELPNEN